MQECDADIPQREGQRATINSASEDDGVAKDPVEAGSPTSPFCSPCSLPRPQQLDRPTPWPALGGCGCCTDYSVMARLGFLPSANPAVRDAEVAYFAAHEVEEATRERRWQELCRGVPLLASAAPSTITALRDLARRTRHGGIPRSLRGVMWLTLTGVARRLDENEYFCASLLRRSGYMTGTYAQAITADLERTFPGHPYFSNKEVGLYKLRNVLHALCWRNPLLNYCQSFNFMAGFLLLIYDDEERTFWMMVYILESLLPNDYFDETLTGARVDQAVMEHVVAERLPRLAAAFGRWVNFDVGAVVPPWLMSLFVKTFPMETVLRVWDYMLTEAETPGECMSAHLEVALAVLKLHEEELLTCEDAGDAMMVLRRGTEALFNGDLLIRTARSLAISPATLHLLRRQLKPLVVQEIREREELRTRKEERRQADLERMHRERAKMTAAVLERETEPAP